MVDMLLITSHGYLPYSRVPCVKAKHMRLEMETKMIFIKKKSLFISLYKISGKVIV